MCQTMAKPVYQSGFAGFYYLHYADPHSRKFFRNANDCHLLVLDETGFAFRLSKINFSFFDFWVDKDQKPKKNGPLRMQKSLVKNGH